VIFSSTLSLWRSIESVYAFAYSGVHGEALRHRLEWFIRPEWPNYAAWWVADDHVPDWHEASERLEHLHDHGPSPQAFDFRHAFGSDAGSIEVRRDVVRDLVARTAIGPQVDGARRLERDAILAVIEDAHSADPVLFGQDAAGHFSRLHDARSGLIF
jgi:hypothetical protein